MAASSEDIERWIKEARRMGATHIISVCDTFDYDDYPVFVMPSDNLEEKMQHYQNTKGLLLINEVIEIVKLSKNKKVQESTKNNFCGYEQHDYESFKKHHVCPDREMHDNVEYEVTLSYSCASAIGSNTYVKCERCGCMQDITDYSQW